MQNKQNTLPLYGPLFFTIVLLLSVLRSDFIAAQGSEYGDFPFFESFLTTTPTYDIVRPDPRGGYITENSAKFTTTGLELTSNVLDKFGAVYVDNRILKSENGFFIEFEYMAHGGSGGDGISVFLFNAHTEPGIGASGAGIGYGYNRSVINSEFNYHRAPGLNGAYLGIALDSYGNFKGLRYQGESRVNGIPYGWAVQGTSYVEPSWNGSNDVTLRGAFQQNGITTGSGVPIRGMEVGYCGYPVLVTQCTTDNLGVKLDPADGFHKRYDQLRAKRGFEVRGGTKFTKSTDPGYRKAFIEMFPNGDKGFYVTVMIQHEQTRDTVIYDYNYTKSFDYYENSIPNEENTSYRLQDGDLNPTTAIRFAVAKRRLEVTLPIEVKIGFAAATGRGTLGRHDYHVIKNVGVRLPRAAEAYDDYHPDVDQSVSFVTFNPLVNDIAYEGLVRRNQPGSPIHIDETSFRFLNNDGTFSSSTSHTVIGQGTWTYDSGTATVTFTPVPGFTGDARVLYDIKGGKTTVKPYADEAYRSLPATIGVKFTVPSTSGRDIISNRMVTGKPK